MVGTSAIVAFFARRLSRARRNAGSVRTIMGLRGIWAQSLGKKLTDFALGVGVLTLSRPMLRRQAGCGLKEAGLDLENGSHVCVRSQTAPIFAADS